MTDMDYKKMSTLQAQIVTNFVATDSDLKDLKIDKKKRKKKKKQHLTKREGEIDDIKL